MDGKDGESLAAKEDQTKDHNVRGSNRHQLLKKRQQQRRNFQERNNLIKIRIQSKNDSSPYNFTPAIPLEELVNNGTFERGPTLSARIRHARQRVPSSEIKIEDAVKSLAQSIAQSQSDTFGMWARLPGIGPSSKPVLKSNYVLGLGQEKEENLLQFRTMLPPLVNKPNETFRDAIYRKDKDAFLQLLRNRRDQKTLTSAELNHALLIAVNRRETELAQLLLMGGADASAFGKYNPLIVQAAFTNNTKMVELLLRFGADPNLQADPLYTPLYFACHRDNMDMVRVLVKNGADVTLASRDSITPLMAAARVGNIKCVRYLLFHCADNLKNKDSMGRTALHYAATCGKQKVVEILLKMGADIFVPDVLGVTPFTAAMMSHNEEIAHLLLPTDIDQHISDPDTGHNNTMLWYAVKYGHFPSVQYLLKKGASVTNASEGNHHPIIKCALQQKNLEVLKLLAPLSDLSSPITKSTDGELNAVQYYVLEQIPSGEKDVTENDFNIVKCLVEHCSDINKRLSNNSTVLLLSCATDDNAHKAKCLLANGADPNIVDENGKSALWCACEREDEDLIRLLIDYNFDMLLSDFVGPTARTPLQQFLTNGFYVDTVAHMVSAGIYLGGIGTFVVKIIEDDDSKQLGTLTIDLLNLLKEKSVNPRSLQELCKLEIKRCLEHQDLGIQIYKLPVPQSVKDYLMPNFVDEHLKLLTDVQ